MTMESKPTEQQMACAQEIAGRFGTFGRRHDLKMAIANALASQPPPGPSVALREALDEVCESMCGRRAIDHDSACNALRAALATAPAEGVDGQDALRRALFERHKDQHTTILDRCTDQVCITLRAALALPAAAQPCAAREALKDLLDEVAPNDGTACALCGDKGDPNCCLHVAAARAAIAAPQPLPSAKPQEEQGKPLGHNPEGVEARWTVRAGDKCAACDLVVDAACLPCEFKGCERHMEEHEATDTHHKKMMNWPIAPEGVEGNPEGVPAEGPPAPAAPHEGEM